MPWRKRFVPFALCLLCLVGSAGSQTGPVTAVRCRRLIDVNMLSPDELKWLNDYHARVNREVRAHLDDNATKLWLDEATGALLPL